MSSPLPSFRYHPHPVDTGAFRERADATCPSCGEATGWAYHGPLYLAGEEPDDLCPWCIASGRAARQYGAAFVGDVNAPIPAPALDELEHRTPGYITWQGEMWMTHCGDAAAYLGDVGWDTLRHLPDVQQSLIDDGVTAEDLRTLQVGDETAVYLFRCLHCGTHLANVDSG